MCFFIQLLLASSKFIVLSHDFVDPRHKFLNIRINSWHCFQGKLREINLNFFSCIIIICSLFRASTTPNDNTISKTEDIRDIYNVLDHIRFPMIPSRSAFFCHLKTALGVHRSLLGRNLGLLLYIQHKGRHRE